MNEVASYLGVFLDRHGDFDHESDGLLPVHVHHLGLAAGGEGGLARLDQGNLCDNNKC